MADRSRTDCSPACPPLVEWPARSLLLSGCPVCGRWPDDDVKVARVLKAMDMVRRCEVPWPDSGSLSVFVRGGVT